MTALTRTEIRWIMNLARNNRDNSKILMDIPGQRYAALHALEYENMESLYNKLNGVVNGLQKRIEVKS